MAFTFGPPGTTVGLAELACNTDWRGLFTGEESFWEIAQLTHPKETAKREMIKSVMPREWFPLLGSNLKATSASLIDQLGL